MKKVLRKVSAVLLTICLLIQSAVSFVSYADGKVSFNDAWLNFEPWTGNGAISLSIGDDFLTKDLNIVSFDEFEELRYKSSDKAVNYTVAESKGNTVITIPEDYLKTLADGTYYLEAEFSRAIIPIKMYVVTKKAMIKDLYYSFGTWNGSGPAQVKFSSPDEDAFTLEAALFKSLSYKGDEIDASNYSIKQFMNVIYITLNEEYVKTLPIGINYFKIDFLNVSFMLKLEIKKQSKPIATNQPDTRIEQPAKPSVAKVKKVSAKKTSKKKQLKVTWKKVNGAKGYQIKASLNKKFKSAKKYNTITKTLNKNKKSAVLKIKKSNKKYYVKVRAYKIYKNSKGKTVKAWGKWSDFSR